MKYGILKYPMSNNRPVTSPGRKTRAYLWRQCGGQTIAPEGRRHATKFRVRKEPICIQLSENFLAQWDKDVNLPAQNQSMHFG